jgi:hypothetical protein
MFETNKVTVRKLRISGSNPQALFKYTNVGKLACRDKRKSDDYYIDYFLNMIQNWTTTMNVPRLAKLGVSPAAINKIVAITDNKNNPVALSTEELTEILESSVL